MVERIVIEDPNEFYYPLSEQAFNDPDVVYHGTSSCFCDSIDSFGWKIGGNPYSKADLSEVIEAFESIGYCPDRRGYVGLSSFRKFSASFTGSYWYARSYYGFKPGGEAISLLLAAIDTYDDFYQDEDEISGHKVYLKKQLETLLPRTVEAITPEFDRAKLPGYVQKTLRDEEDKLQLALRNIHNESHLAVRREALQRIRTKYSSMIDRCYPVVYAVRIKPELLEGRNMSQWIGNSWDFSPGVHATGDVPSEAILTKVDFPNGAHYFVPDNDFVPVRWKAQWFEDWKETNPDGFERCRDVK